MPALFTDSNQKTVHLRNITSIWSCRKRDTIPLKIYVFFYFVRIRFVCTVLRKRKRHKRHFSTVKIFLCHFFPIIECIQTFYKLHCFCHICGIEIALFAVFVKQLPAIRIEGLRPVIIVCSKLVNLTIPIGVLRHTFTNARQIIPGPVIFRHRKSLFV